MTLLDEALSPWTPEDVARRLAERVAPALLARYAAAVRALAGRAGPDGRAALVEAARAVLGASASTRLALCADPALARWTGAAAGAPGGAQGARLVALAPRFTVAVALLDGGDATTRVPLGPHGRARIPGDGRLLEGPAGASLPVAVRAGTLHAPALPRRSAGPFAIALGDEDEGRMPRFQALTGEPGEAVETVSAGAAVLATTAPLALAEAAALAPVLYPIAAEPGVSRSASIPDVRGAIWLSPCDRPLVLAETLVHEASHLKFYLAEDAFPATLDPDAPRYAVPWRPDPRPIRTVLMGLHAWVRVMEWLRTLDGTPWAQQARERLAVLGAGTATAADLVRRADGLTDAGRALGEALAAQL